MKYAELNMKMTVLSPILTLATRPIVTTWLFALLLGFNVPCEAVQDTTTNYQYDADGNLNRIASPLDTPGNPVTTDLGYDALNRINSILQASPAVGSVRPDILLTHDGQDQLTQVNDPRGLITDTEANGIGNTNTLSSPDSGITGNTYDEAGNLKTRFDARGLLTTYSYDAANRLSQINYADGTLTHFSYDSYDGSPTSNPATIGQLTRIDDESGVTIYFYDVGGRRTYKYQNPTLTNPQQSWDKSVAYTYGTIGTAKGKLSSLTYPSGNRINYSYDAAGRILSITLNPTSTNGIGTNTAVTTKLLTAIQYTPASQFRSGVWGNNTTTKPSVMVHGDDLDGRVSTYHLGNPKQSGTVRTLTYDAASRITQMTHTGIGTSAFAPANFNQSISYDNLDRITAYTSATGNQSYGYDETGNRISTGSDNHVIDLGSNRLLNTSGPVPAKNNSYDAAGNLLSDGTTTYTYSAGGRLHSAQQGSALTTYAYNGLGQRVMKRGATDAGIIQYVYDEQGHLIGEYNVYGNPIQETVYLGDIPIAVLTQTVGSTTTGSVLVDNSATANVTAVGSWPVATTIPGFQGSNYQTHIATTTTTDSFTWKPKLPLAATGKYWLQARWTADATRAANVTYTTTDIFGSTTVKTVDQRSSNNTWVTLALQYKSAGLPMATVKLSPSSLGTVSADAVRALPAVVTTSVNYIFTDHLNTPRVITRASDNKIVWRWDQSDPFGVKAPNENPSALGTFTYNPRFPGQLYDAESGLYYNYFRHYDPKTGGFTQSDPIGLAGGINTYAYVGGNPVNWIDPLGLKPGDKYKTQEEAGYEAACEINPTSISDNLEYAGSIYQNDDGTFSYTNPAPGIDSESSNPMKSLPPDGRRATAWYHTHAGYDEAMGAGNFRFSPNDRAFSNATKKPNYMADPYNNAHRYNPPMGKNKNGSTFNFKEKCGCKN